MWKTHSKDLPLCFRVFHFYSRSFSSSQTALGALQGTQHLVPRLPAHLQKVVWIVPVLDWCFTGSHLSPRVWSCHRSSGVSPMKLCFVTQGIQHWGMCRQKPGHYWPSARSCAGRSSPLISPKESHDILSPLVSCAASSSGNPGSETPQGRQGQGTLRILIGINPWLPPCQVP